MGTVPHAHLTRQQPGCWPMTRGAPAMGDAHPARCGRSPRPRPSASLAGDCHSTEPDPIAETVKEPRPGRLIHTALQVLPGMVDLLEAVASDVLATDRAGP